MTEAERFAKYLRESGNPLNMRAGDIITEQAQTIALMNNVVHDLKEAAKRDGAAWIAVKDAKPKPLDHILIFDGESVIEGYMTMDGRFIHYDYEAEAFSGQPVEWWRPMPDPPEVVSNDTGTDER